MSTRFLRRTVSARDPLALLERMLNRTTLSTKRVVHGQIIELGNASIKKTEVVIDDGRDQAVRDALSLAERRHRRELRAALQRLEAEMTREKDAALARQKEYYEDLSERVATQRDGAEQEKIRDLRRRLGTEREEALKQQWSECEELERVAVKKACDAQLLTIQEQLQVDKACCADKAVAEAQEGFKKREEETIRTTQDACQKSAKKAENILRKEHGREIEKHQQRYVQILKRLKSEIDMRNQIEQDFQDLQNDYCRFIDYTDGFQSDYLMNIRPFNNCQSEETNHEQADGNQVLLDICI